MKTPRELLLARHQSAEPKLDAIRQEVVAKMETQNPTTESQNLNLASWCLGGLKMLWLELVFPSRRIWTGLAATWLLILIANFSLQVLSRPTVSGVPTSPQVVMSLPQQEKLLAQSTAPEEPAATEPPRPYVPRPASLRPFEIITT